MNIFDGFVFEYVSVYSEINREFSFQMECMTIASIVEADPDLTIMADVIKVRCLLVCLPWKFPEDCFRLCKN